LCNTTDKMRPDAGRRLRIYHWWPVLLGPATMIGVYLAKGFNLEGFYAKRLHETFAVIILPLAIISYGAGAAYGRRPFHLILTVLTIALFCREWHFAGTGIGIYISLVGIGVWTYLWREKIKPALQYRSFRIWLISTCATYLLSVLISRRLFKHLFLPMEGKLHVPLEEVTETAAHLMMLVTSLIAWSILRADRSERFHSVPAVSTPSEPH